MTAGIIEWARRLGPVDVFTLLFLPAFWIVGFGVFALRCAIWGMPRTARIDKVAASPYLPRIIMEYGYWMFTLPIDLFVRLRISANLITIGSLVVTVAAAAAFAVGQFGIGGWLLFLAFMGDAWDGIVARRTNTSSIVGEFFDSTIDRYADLIGFLGFMYYYRNDPFPLLVTTLAMVGSTLVSYTRAKGEAVGIDPNVGYMQRHERAVYLGCSTVLAPQLAAWLEPHAEHRVFHLTVATLTLVAILANYTAIWRALVVVRGLRARERAAGRPPESDETTEFRIEEPAERSLGG